MGADCSLACLTPDKESGRYVCNLNLLELSPPCIARLFHTLSVVEVFRGDVGLSLCHWIEVCVNRRTVCDFEVIHIVGSRWVWVGDLARRVHCGRARRLGGRLRFALHSHRCWHAVHTGWKNYLEKEGQ